jgi:heme exporter protein B
LYLQIKHLIIKDLMLEWRQKYALNGMLLYVVSTSYICYASFKLRANEIDPITWNTIFWIVLLFVSLMSLGKSFNQEKEGQLLYLYTLISPEAMIFSKIIYNTLLLSTLATVQLVVYSLFMGNPVINIFIFYLSVLLGAIGFASALSLVAGVASKANNSAMLMAVLSFPIIIPILLLLLKISKNAMDGLDVSSIYDELFLLLALDAIVTVLSVILYPYLWRS